MDLNALSVEIGEWHRRTFPGKSLLEIALKLGEESGEAEGALVKRGETMRGERRGTIEEWDANFAEELGHVLHVVLVLAHYSGLDIEYVLKETWAKTSKRVWT